MAELKKNLGMKTGVRHALTIPQQRAFMEYIATHPIYFHWWPILRFFLELVPNRRSFRDSMGRHQL